MYSYELSFLHLKDGHQSFLSLFGLKLYEIMEFLEKKCEFAFFCIQLNKNNIFDMLHLFLFVIFFINIANLVSLSFPTNPKIQNAKNPSEKNLDYVDLVKNRVKEVCLQFSIAVIFSSLVPMMKFIELSTTIK